MLEQIKSLMAAMEILPDGLLIVDQQQRIVACNHAAEHLFGYLHGELIGQALDILIPPALREAHRRNVDAYGPADDARPMQNSSILSGISKDGKQLRLSIGISTIRGSSESYFVAIVRDAAALDDTLNEAVNLSHLDPLTQLGNRRYLSAQIAALGENGGNATLALLFLDLDRFKPLNDQYGHEMGDKVLKIVARRLRGSLRSCDTCVRLGGDEFIVMLPGIKEPQALANVARKLHQRLVAPIRARNETVSVGVSIGGIIGPPVGGDIDGLLEQADAAMYRAKTCESGYCFVAPSSAAAA